MALMPVNPDRLPPPSQGPPCVSGLPNSGKKLYVIHFDKEGRLETPPQTDAGNFRVDTGSCVEMVALSGTQPHPVEGCLVETPLGENLYLEESVDDFGHHTFFFFAQCAGPHRFQLKYRLLPRGSKAARAAVAAAVAVASCTPQTTSTSTPLTPRSSASAELESSTTVAAAGEGHMPQKGAFSADSVDLTVAFSVESVIIVEPLLHINGRVLRQESISVQTVLSHCLGPFPRWRKMFTNTSQLGYNVIHFTPLQSLGESGSCYSIADQLHISEFFLNENSKPPNSYSSWSSSSSDSSRKRQASTSAGTSGLKRASSTDIVGFEELKAVIQMLEEKLGLLSVTDLVLNHTASNSQWLQEHPDSGYTLENSPWLRGAYELDVALQDFNKRLVRGEFEQGYGATRFIESEQQLRNVMTALKKEALLPFDLHSWFQLDIERTLQLWRAAAVAAAATTEAAAAATTDPLARETLLALAAPEVTGHEQTVQLCFQEALKQVGIARGRSIVLSAEYLLCHFNKQQEQQLHAVLQQVSEKLQQKATESLDVILKSIEGNTRWERLQCRRGPLTENHWESVAPRYFTPIQSLVKEKDQQSSQQQNAEEKQEKVKDDVIALANNGWVMGWDATKDFAAPGALVYLRRELAVWSDCVKLRYGSKPEDAPFLWQHMTEYCRIAAKVFHGARLDNCHSTPIHVAQHMLRECRRLRPQFWVFAELFTGSQQMDLFFEKSLGVNALLREAMQTSSPQHLAAQLNKFSAGVSSSNCPPSSYYDAAAAAQNCRHPSDFRSNALAGAVASFHKGLAPLAALYSLDRLAPAKRLVIKTLHQQPQQLKHQQQQPRKQQQQQDHDQQPLHQSPPSPFSRQQPQNKQQQPQPSIQQHPQHQHQKPRPLQQQQQLQQQEAYRQTEDQPQRRLSGGGVQPQWQVKQSQQTAEQQQQCDNKGSRKSPTGGGAAAGMGGQKKKSVKKSPKGAVSSTNTACSTISSGKKTSGLSFLQQQQQAGVSSPVFYNQSCSPSSEFEENRSDTMCHHQAQQHAAACSSHTLSESAETAATTAEVSVEQSGLSMQQKQQQVSEQQQPQKDQQLQKGLHSSHRNEGEPQQKLHTQRREEQKEQKQQQLWGNEMTCPIPLRPSPCPALFYDCTHDNETPAQKMTAATTLPNSVLLAAAACAVGSTRGYDELVPRTLSVVAESRAYQHYSSSSSDKLAQQQQQQQDKRESELQEQQQEDKFCEKEEDDDIPSEIVFRWRHGGQKVVVRGEWDNWKNDLDCVRTADGSFAATLHKGVHYLTSTSGSTTSKIERGKDLIHFKFIVDGVWAVNRDLPSDCDGKGNTNNVFCADGTSPSSCPQWKRGEALPGILGVRGTLNNLHVKCGQGGFSEGLAISLTEDTIVYVRFQPLTHECVYFIARCAYTRDKLADRGPLPPIVLSGKIKEMPLLCTLVVDRAAEENFKAGLVKINGLCSNLQQQSDLSAVLAAPAEFNEASQSTLLLLNNFPAGSALILCTCPHYSSLSATCKGERQEKPEEEERLLVLKGKRQSLETEMNFLEPAVQERELRERFERLPALLEETSLCDLSQLLFSCEAEERCRKSDAYQVPEYGKLVYAGLSGPVALLDQLRLLPSDQQQQHPLVKNIVQGYWLLRYMSDRIGAVSNLGPVQKWISAVADLLEKHRPIYAWLRPFYVDVVLSRLYAISAAHALQHMPLTATPVAKTPAAAATDKEEAPQKKTDFEHEQTTRLPAAGTGSTQVVEELEANQDCEIGRGSAPAAAPVQRQAEFSSDLLLRCSALKNKQSGTSAWYGATGLPSTCHVSPGDLLLMQLSIATLQFYSFVPSAPLIYNTHKPCLAAGLPFFSAGFMRAWGRDTFIALKGLLLTTGRFDEAKEEILGFARVLRHGLIPNLLDAGNNPRYNARDATWFFCQAIQDYCMLAPEGVDFLRTPVQLKFEKHASQAPELPLNNLADMLHHILLSHAKGIEFREWNAGKKIDEHMRDEGFNIKIYLDIKTGMIYGGNRFNCGTWMDKNGSSQKAHNKGLPATPRDGAAIEIIGLLKSTLRFVNLLPESVFPYKSVTTSTGETLSYDRWNELLQTNFEKLFYIPQEGEKGEFVLEEKFVNRRGSYKDSFRASEPWADYQLRPNACVALALAPELFTPRRACAYLALVEEVLLGEQQLGMKTLDPTDWNYRPDYDNGNDSDDSRVAHGYNYHQGPEWLWPLGYFLRAKLLFCKTDGEDDAAALVIEEQSNVEILQSEGLKEESRKSSSNVQAVSRAEAEKDVAAWQSLTRDIREECMKLLHVHRTHIQKNCWRSLPELTNANGNFCKDSCPAQAWSVGTILAFLGDLLTVIRAADDPRNAKKLLFPSKNFLL